MRIIQLLLIVGLSLALATTATLYRRTLDGYGNVKQEVDVLIGLHHGGSRADFYRLAKRIGIVPLRSDNGLPDGALRDAFPESTRRFPHPRIQMFFFHSGDDFFLWRQDILDVEFDANDRIAHWNVDVSQTGV